MVDATAKRGDRTDVSHLMGLTGSNRHEVLASYPLILRANRIRLHDSLLDEFRAWTLHTLIVQEALLRKN